MKTKTKHTPGPWTQHPYTLSTIVGDRGEQITHDIAHVCAIGSAGTIAANIRLIAAAPELLEACKHAHASMIMLRTKFTGLLAPDFVTLVNVEIAECEAAITAAEEERK